MKKVISAFKEHKVFREHRHWDAIKIHFERDIVTQPHYADTIEIIVSHGASGVIHIGGSRYEISKEGAYFIAPGAVHAMQYDKSDGFVTVLKIEHLTLTKYLNIEKIIADLGHSFYSLAHYIEPSDALFNLERTFYESKSLDAVLIAILSFFRDHRKLDCPKSQQASISSKELCKIIEWTENNYLNSPTLEKAASVLGYTKNYFCKKFKFYGAGDVILRVLLSACEPRGQE